MTDMTLPSYETAAATLKSYQLAVSPAELHGLLTGMICGGLALDNQMWLGPVCDYANEGEPLTDGAKTFTETLFTTTSQELVGGDFDFTLLLPSDEADLFERAEALTEWVSSFMSGFGLVGVNTSQLPEAVTEALADLRDITQLGIDEDDDMEEQAVLFEQVTEHVRMCVLTCYAELGQSVVDENDSKPTLH